MQNMKKADSIVASENWPGFTFTFANGWSVSVQQSKNHNCKVGRTVEVAIFSPPLNGHENWWGYDEEEDGLFLPEDSTYVNNSISSDTLAKIFACVSEQSLAGEFDTKEEAEEFAKKVEESLDFEAKV